MGASRMADWQVIGGGILVWAVVVLLLLRFFHAAPAVDDDPPYEPYHDPYLAEQVRQALHYGD